MSQSKCHTREWWVPIVERQRNSHLNLKEFSASVGVHPDTLGWWRRRLAKEAAAEPSRPASTLVRVQVAPDAPAPVVEPGRVRVVQADVGAVSIRFEVGTDARYLSELLVNIARSVQSC